MITRELIQELSRFESKSFPVVSFFLNLDVDQVSTGAYKIAAKGLAKEVKQGIKDKEKEYSREQVKSLTSDIEAFIDAVNSLQIPARARGFVMFTCSGEDFSRKMYLPRPVADFVKIGADPVIRLLTNTFDQFKHFGICTVDNTRALAAAAYMNTFDAIEEMKDDIHTQRSRYGGGTG